MRNFVINFNAMKRWFGIFLIVFVVGCISMSAQTKTKNSPYRAGEVLNYEGNFSKLILRGIDVADLNFTVSQMPDSEDFLVTSEARSKGTLIKLFNFKFYQRIESVIDDKSYNILKTVKRDEQGDRVREGEAVFDYKTDKVTYIETDPNDEMRVPRRVASPIEKNTQDFISAIYMMRSLPLKVGKSFVLNVSDSGVIYKVPVRVTAREKQKSILGKKWCFRVEPEVFGTNRLIEKEGDMTIWITDDDQRIPVRSRINTNIGKIEVRLRSISKAK